jgi:hypothetical protein
MLWGVAANSHVKFPEKPIAHVHAAQSMCIVLVRGHGAPPMTQQEATHESSSSNSGEQLHPTLANNFIQLI